jgi:hypothetical protein
MSSSPADRDVHVGGAEIVIRPDDPPGPGLDATLADLASSSAATTWIAARELDVDVLAATLGESTALMHALDRLALTERIEEYVRARGRAMTATRRPRDTCATVPRQRLAPRRRSSCGGGRPGVRRTHAPPGSDSSGEDGPGEPGAGARHHDVEQSCRAVVA